VPIQPSRAANGGRQSIPQQQTHMPLKGQHGRVIPVIFAVIDLAFRRRFVGLYRNGLPIPDTDSPSSSRLQARGIRSVVVDSADKA